MSTQNISGKNIVPQIKDGGAGRPLWTWLALVVAAGATMGSLYLSIGMGLQACPLCFYQRTFMMGVLGVLAVGLLGTRSVHSSLFSLLSLALAVGGLGVAAFHVYLELSGKLECPGGLFGLGTVPQQSLASFALLTVLLLVDVLRGHASRPATITSGAAVVLGIAFTVGCIKSSSPPCPPNYDKPFLSCRPPQTHNPQSAIRNPSFEDRHGSSAV